MRHPSAMIPLTQILSKGKVETNMNDTTINLIRDSVDIVLVSFIMYRLLLVLKGTRAVQILLGLFFVFSVYITSQFFGLITLTWVLDHFFTYLVLIMVILFQDEIRTALTRVGKLNLFGGLHTLDADLVEELLRAVYQLRDDRVGALIAIERNDSIGTYVKSGKALDAKLSKELLVGLFHTSNPLHDGAIIIRGNSVAAAGCFLPLAMDDDLPRWLGTRHRAALGMSRESDAVLLVVSEERQTVSLVYENDILSGLEIETMRSHLQKLVGERGLIPEKLFAIQHDRKQTKENTP